jgi:hypothetical protein
VREIGERERGGREHNMCQLSVVRIQVCGVECIPPLDILRLVDGVHVISMHCVQSF